MGYNKRTEQEYSYTVHKYSQPIRSLYDLIRISVYVQNDLEKAVAADILIFIFFNIRIHIQSFSMVLTKILSCESA